MDGAMRRVRENVVVTTATMRLTADAVDWNTETGQIEARGNVHFENLQDGQKMSCQLAQYDVNADTGKFFNVSGSAPAKVEFKPGLLMTQNPYYFEGETLDKTKDRYVLHKGFITDCKKIAVQ